MSVAVEPKRSSSRRQDQLHTQASKIVKVFDYGEKKYILVVKFDELDNVNEVSVKVREYPIYPYSNYVDHELWIERRRTLTVGYATCSDSWGSPGCSVHKAKFKRFREVAKKMDVFNLRRYEEIKTFNSFIDAVESIARFIIELVKNSRELEYAKSHHGKTKSYTILGRLEEILNGVKDIIYMLDDPILYEDLSEEIDKLKQKILYP